MLGEILKPLTHQSQLTSILRYQYCIDLRTFCATRTPGSFRIPFPVATCDLSICQFAHNVDYRRSYIPTSPPDYPNTGERATATATQYCHDIDRVGSSHCDYGHRCNHHGDRVQFRRGSDNPILEHCTGKQKVFSIKSSDLTSSKT